MKEHTPRDALIHTHARGHTHTQDYYLQGYYVFFSALLRDSGRTLYVAYALAVAYFSDAFVDE